MHMSDHVISINGRICSYFEGSDEEGESKVKSTTPAVEDDEEDDPLEAFMAGIAVRMCVCTYSEHVHMYTCACMQVGRSGVLVFRVLIE